MTEATVDRVARAIARTQMISAAPNLPAKVLDAMAQRDADGWRKEAIAAIAAMPTPGEWRPIAEAPRDGTQFLALVSNGWYAIVSAPVDGAREGWPYQWWRSSDRQSYPVVETHPKGYDWNASSTLLLTHWTPLPPAPVLP